MLENEIICLSANSEKFFSQPTWLILFAFDMNAIKTVFLLLVALVVQSSSVSSLRGEGAVRENEHQGRELFNNKPVYLFEDWDWKGKLIFLEVGSLSYFKLRETRIGNDSVSSFVIADGHTLIACVNEFQWCFTFKESVKRLYALNDAFSSFVVVKDLQP